MATINTSFNIGLINFVKYSLDKKVINSIQSLDQARLPMKCLFTIHRYPEEHKWGSRNS